MGKKDRKSLKERIDDLVNALGGSTKPTQADIRSKLVEFSLAAEELENGVSIRELEAKIAAVEKANEKLKTEKNHLKVQVLEAKNEINRFREEEKKRQEEEAELPNVQFKILKRLPSENGGISWTLEEIAYMAGIPVDETEVHLSRLRGFGLIQRTWGYNEHIWFRTEAGTKVVMADRLATEEEQRKPNRHKHGDLRKDAQEILLLIARNEEGIKEQHLMSRSGADAYLYLDALQRGSYINTNAPMIGRLYGERVFTLARNGAEYLEERGLI